MKKMKKKYFVSGVKKESKKQLQRLLVAAVLATVYVGGFGTSAVTEAARNNDWTSTITLPTQSGSRKLEINASEYANIDIYSLDSDAIVLTNTDPLLENLVLSLNSNGKVSVVSDKESGSALIFGSAEDFGCNGEISITADNIRFIGNKIGGIGMGIFATNTIVDINKDGIKEGSEIFLSGDKGLYVDGEGTVVNINVDKFETDSVVWLKNGAKLNLKASDINVDTASGSSTSYNTTLLIGDVENEVGNCDVMIEGNNIRFSSGANDCVSIGQPGTGYSSGNISIIQRKRTGAIGLDDKLSFYGLEQAFSWWNWMNQGDPKNKLLIDADEVEFRHKNSSSSYAMRFEGGSADIKAKKFTAEGIWYRRGCNIYLDADDIVIEKGWIDFYHPALANTDGGGSAYINQRNGGNGDMLIQGITLRGPEFLLSGNDILITAVINQSGSSTSTHTITQKTAKAGDKLEVNTKSYGYSGINGSGGNLTVNADVLEMHTSGNSLYTGNGPEMVLDVNVANDCLIDSDTDALHAGGSMSIDLSAKTLDVQAKGTAIYMQNTAANGTYINVEAADSISMFGNSQGIYSWHADTDITIKSKLVNLGSVSGTAVNIVTAGARINFVGEDESNSVFNMLKNSSGELGLISNSGGTVILQSGNKGTLTVNADKITQTSGTVDVKGIVNLNVNSITNNITVDNGATLTVDASAIQGATNTNNGKIILKDNSGTLTKTITGGSVKVEENVSFSASNLSGCSELVFNNAVYNFSLDLNTPTADVITLASGGSASGNLKLGNIKITGTYDSGKNIFAFINVNDGTNSVAVKTTNIIQGTDKYTFEQVTGTPGSLQVTKGDATETTLIDVINNTNGAGDIDSYVLTANYTATADLGTLTRVPEETSREFILNGNKKNFSGDSGTYTGIKVNTGDTLNIYDLATVSGWKDYFVDNSGTLNIDGTQQMELQSAIKGNGDLHISTNVNVSGDGSITQKTVTIDSGKTLTIGANKLNVSGTVTNNGTMTFNAGGAVDVAVNGAGTVNLGTGSAMEFTVKKGIANNVSLRTNTILNIDANDVKGNITGGNTTSSVINLGTGTLGGKISTTAVKLMDNVSAYGTQFTGTGLIDLNGNTLTITDGNLSVVIGSTEKYTGTLRFVGTSTLSKNSYAGILNEGNLTVSPQYLNGGIKNIGTLKLNVAGDLVSDITDNATPQGTLVISDNTVTNSNNCDITQKSLTVTSTFTTDPDNLHISDSIAVKGTLNLDGDGSIGTNFDLTGKLNTSGNVTMSGEVAGDGTLNNSGTLDIPWSNIKSKVVNIGTMNVTGGGELSGQNFGGTINLAGDYTVDCATLSGAALTADTVDVDSTSKLALDNLTKDDVEKSFKILEATTISGAWADLNGEYTNKDEIASLILDKKVKAFTVDNTNGLTITIDKFGASFVEPGSTEDGIQTSIYSVATLMSDSEDEKVQNFMDALSDIEDNQGTAAASNAIETVANMSAVAGVQSGTASMVNSMANNLASNLGSSARPNMIADRGGLRNTASDNGEVKIDTVEVGKAANVMPERYLAKAYNKEVWASYIHSKQHVDGLKAGMLDSKSVNQYNGVTVGADLWSGKHSFGGVALSYADGNVNAGNLRNDTDYYGVSIYNRHDYKGLTMLTDVSYTHSKNDINISGTQEITADAKADAIGVGVRFETPVTMGKTTVTPYAGARYTYLKNNDYDNNLGMNYDTDNQNLVTIPVGLEISAEFAMPKSDWTFRPVLEGGYVWNLGDRDGNTKIGYMGAYDIVGFETSDPGQYFIRAAMQFAKADFTCEVGYRYSKGKSVRDNRWNVNLNYMF